MNFDLSVIIPTYKRTESLERLLICLLRQQDINIEIIVVDQNPQNYFLDSIEQLLKKVKVVKQPTPNASLARNSGFLHSKAAVVVFIDDDLIPDDDFCRKGLQIFVDFPGIDCYIPLVYNNQGKTSHYSRQKKRLKKYEGNANVFSISDSMSAVVFFKREYYKRTGGFDVFLFSFAKTAEDQEFFLRMLKKKLTVWFVPFVEIFHDDNVSGGCDLRWQDYWVTREKCIKSWAFRYRIHNKYPGKISVNDLFKLFRSAFINKEVLVSGRKNIVKQIKLTVQALVDSKVEFYRHRLYYQDSKYINHLNDFKEILN